jgi:hypothetical protein
MFVAVPGTRRHPMSPRGLGAALVSAVGYSALTRPLLLRRRCGLRVGASETVGASSTALVALRAARGGGLPGLSRPRTGRPSRLPRRVGREGHSAVPHGLGRPAPVDSETCLRESASRAAIRVNCSAPTPRYVRTRFSRSASSPRSSQSDTGWSGGSSRSSTRVQSSSTDARTWCCNSEKPLNPGLGCEADHGGWACACPACDARDGFEGDGGVRVQARVCDAALAGRVRA